MKTCRNGHELDDNNVLLKKERGKVYRRCRTCYRRKERDARRRYRAKMTEEQREEVRAYHREYHRRPEVREKNIAYLRARRKQGLVPPRKSTPESRARARARYAAKRDALGLPSRAEWREQKAAKREEPYSLVPPEVRACWRESQPGSVIRRLFPSMADLRRAEWDPVNRTIRKREVAA